MYHVSVIASLKRWEGEGEMCAQRASCIHTRMVGWNTSVVMWERVGFWCVTEPQGATSQQGRAARGQLEDAELRN